MTGSAVAREAWRNIVTGTTRTAICVVAVALVLIGLQTVEHLALRRAVVAAQEYQAAGAATIVLTAGGRIDGAACDRLADLDAVTAAGAIRAVGHPLTPAALPDNAVPLHEATSGLLDQLGTATTGAPGVVLSAEAAAVLAARPGRAVETARGPVEVAGVYPWPDDGRRPGLGYAAIAPVPAHEIFDECWVTSWPVPTDIVAVLGTTVTPGRGTDAEPPRISQLNANLGARFTAGGAFDGRPTRYAPLAGVVICGSIGYLAVRTRRVQHAGLLHDGVTPAALAGITALEITSWVAPAAVLAAAWAALAARAGPAEAATASVLLAAQVSAPALVAASACALAALGRTRQRHLVRYVRDR